MVREREGMSICKTVKTWKWSYLHNTRSAYFPRERERDAMSICEMSENTEMVLYP